MLREVVGKLPGGVVRQGQERMASAVASALESGRHLLVQAGTGTGKSLAYLVPVLAAGRRAVVSTATKALQEQLAGKDLPWLASALGRDVSYALLKGRSNYLCLAKASDAQLTLESPEVAGEVSALLEWLPSTETGDRSDAPVPVSEAAWRSVSAGADECPGAMRCAYGGDCFAELARERAALADVVVVNHSLLASDLAAGARVLPERDVVVVDEAHEFERIVTSAWSAEVSAWVLERLARRAEPYAEDLSALFLLGEFLRDLPDGRVTSWESTSVFVAASEALATASVAAGASEDEWAVTVRAALDAMRSVLARAVELSSDDVVWVERGVLRVAPLAVGPALAERLFGRTTVVATSATLAVGGSFSLPAARFGLGDDEWDGLDAGSPFDHGRQAILYTPRSLAGSLHDELALLIEAAGGRTLALFTSVRAVREAAEALAPVLDCPLHVQGDAPPAVLVREFAADERSCLFGTSSFWQGVDIAGPACSLVTIDRLPFPRPDDPLAVAQRAAVDAAGGDGFAEVYLARAAVLLAQGAGRLIRGAADRGVVAVLDPRLSTRSYGRVLVSSLPPMWRTSDREVVLAALRRLADRPPAAASRGTSVDS